MKANSRVQFSLVSTLVDDIVPCISTLCELNLGLNLFFSEPNQSMRDHRIVVRQSVQKAQRYARLVQPLIKNERVHWR
jgi:hypothetical protein